MEFNTITRNRLLTGLTLVYELPMDKEFRIYVVIGGYEYHYHPIAEEVRIRDLSKFLKTDGDAEKVYFYITSYGISKDFKPEWNAYPEDLINYMNIKDIKGISALENKLLELFENINLNNFIPWWESDAPL